MMRRQASSSDPSTGWPPPTPALFTRRSRPGTRSFSRANPAATELASLTSMVSGIASAPRWRISDAACSSCAAVRAAIATVAAGSANNSASARAMPRPPPVTRIEGMVKASLGPHVVPAPVAAELVQESEGLEGLHSVEKKHAVEMIGFVLDDTRGKAGGRKIHLFPRAIEGPHDDLPRALNAGPDVGNAQAPFPVFDDITGSDFDLRVDQGHQRHVFTVLVGFLVFVHVPSGRKSGNKNPQRFMHLRRRESDSLVLLHRLEHVVDELLDCRGPNLRRVHRASLRAQHRMLHARDLQNRHTRIICATICH